MLLIRAAFDTHIGGIYPAQPGGVMLFSAREKEKDPFSTEKFSKKTPLYAKYTLTLYV